MLPSLRKLLLTVHITFSVGWLGAVVAYLALVVAALTSQDTQTVTLVFRALEVMGWFVIVPMAVVSLVSGIVQSVVTPWGVLRHYWVVFKLVLTTLATIVLLMNMPTVSALADIAVERNSPDVAGLRSQLLHAAGGLLVLLVTTVLGVYKPRGLTPYGWRKQRELRAETYGAGQS